MSVVVTAALSVSEQIKDLGAYAGVASIVGLAVLSLLYFGQARELKRLREWAGRAPERTAELQEQAAAAGPRRVVAQPGAVRAATQPTASPVLPAPATAAAAAATRPGAPGALEITKPATAAAAATPAPSATPAGAGAPVVPAVPAVQPAASAGQETQAMDAVPAPPASDPLVVAPGTPAPPVGPAPDATDPTTGSQEAPVPLVKASAGGAVGQRPSRPVVSSEPASVRARAAEPRPPAEQEKGSRRGILGYAAGGVAVLLVLVVLVTQLFGGDDPQPTSDASIPVPTQTEPEPNAIEDPTSSAATPTEAPALVRSEFSVFVLNGTATNGLGASVNKKLETLGYRPAGSPQTAADQTEAVTRVSYASGKKRAAIDVAKQLGVATANVVPADAGTSAQGAGADIIVTIGADKAAQ